MRFFSGIRKFFLLAFVAASLASAPGSRSVFAQDEDDGKRAEALRLFNRGQAAHQQGDLQAALKFYDEALRLSPELPEAELQRGAVFTTLGKLSEAEKAFRRAAELRDEWAPPLTNLGVILVSTDRFAEAEKVLTRAIEIDEEEFQAYASLTELRLRSKSPPEKLRELLAKIRALTADNKEEVSLWAAQGALENATGDSAAAKASLNQALALEPQNSFALSERAEIFRSEKNFPDALKDARLAVKISPGSLNAKLRLASILAQSGDAAEAARLLDSLDASNAEVAALKDSVAASRKSAARSAATPAVGGSSSGGGVEENVPALEKQLERDAGNVDVLARLCVLTRVSSPQKALEYCRRASAAEPDNVSHAVNFGAALVQSRQFDGAVGLFRRIIQVAPDNFAAHANLATALFESNRFPEAAAEFKWLAEKKPELAIAYYFLAISHDQMGEYVEALANYRKFLQLADVNQNRLEIEKVNLRLPGVEKLAKTKGKKR